MASFDTTTPFMLLARIHVKPGCVDQYLELARVPDEAVQASEPGMIHHTLIKTQTIHRRSCGQRSTPTTRRSAPMSPTLLFRSICKSTPSSAMASALRFTARSAMNACSSWSRLAFHSKSLKPSSDTAGSERPMVKVPGVLAAMPMDCCSIHS